MEKVKGCPSKEAFISALGEKVGDHQREDSSLTTAIEILTDVFEKIDQIKWNADKYKGVDYVKVLGLFHELGPLARQKDKNVFFAAVAEMRSMIGCILLTTSKILNPYLRAEKEMTPEGADSLDEFVKRVGLDEIDHDIILDELGYQVEYIKKRAPEMIAEAAAEFILGPEYQDPAKAQVEALENKDKANVGELLLALKGLHKLEEELDVCKLVEQIRIKMEAIDGIGELFSGWDESYQEVTKGRKQLTGGREPKIDSKNIEAIKESERTEKKILSTGGEQDITDMRDLINEAIAQVRKPLYKREVTAGFKTLGTLDLHADSIGVPRLFIAYAELEKHQGSLTDNGEDEYGIIEKIMTALTLAIYEADEATKGHMIEYANGVSAIEVSSDRIPDGTLEGIRDMKKELITTEKVIDSQTVANLHNKIEPLIKELEEIYEERKRSLEIFLDQLKPIRNI